MIGTAIATGKEILELALKHWKTVAVVAAIAGTFYAGKHYSDTEHSGMRNKLIGKYNTKVANLERDLAEARSQADQAVRDIERASADAIAAIDTKHQQELTNAKRKADAVIADLRAGNYRLRNGLACKVGGSSSAIGAEIGTAAGLGDAGAQAGLYESFVGNVLRIGAEADEVVIQLQACQSIIRKDRGHADLQEANP